MSLGEWEKFDRKGITSSQDPKVRKLLEAIKAGGKLQIRYEKRVFNISNLTIVSGKKTAEYTRKPSPGRVACTIDYVELCGDNGPVDSV